MTIARPETSRWRDSSRAPARAYLPARVARAFRPSTDLWASELAGRSSGPPCRSRRTAHEGTPNRSAAPPLSREQRSGGRRTNRGARARPGGARVDADVEALGVALGEFDGVWGSLDLAERARVLGLVLSEVVVDGATGTPSCGSGGQDDRPRNVPRVRHGPKRGSVGSGSAAGARVRGRAGRRGRALPVWAEVAAALGLSRSRLSEVMRRRWAGVGDQEGILAKVRAGPPPRPGAASRLQCFGRALLE
jgi:hypothetical protein